MDGEAWAWLHSDWLHSDMALFAGNSSPHREPARRAAARQPRARQAANTPSPSGVIVETDIPARLDALPFGRFHVLVIVALGITWILDGLEVTLAGALSGELKDSSALGLSNGNVYPHVDGCSPQH